MWDWLGRGFNLERATDEAGTGVRNSTEIETNFMYYGVSDDQYVWFRYPDIN